MKTGEVPKLGSARDLAAFHDERWRSYEGFALLLGACPSGETLKAVGLVGGDGVTPPPMMRARRELRDALVATPVTEMQREFSLLFEGARPAVARRCELPAAAARVAACAAAGVPPKDRASELSTLATLAHRTARALAGSLLYEAAELDELQVRLLREHAAACLGSLVVRIEQQEGCLFYNRVGRALGWLLDDDVRLLGVSVER